MSPSSFKVMPVLGTRPEAIKLAPVIHLLQSADDFGTVVATTGQHRDMLDEMLGELGLGLDVDLDIFRPGQSLEAITALSLERMTAAIDRHSPDCVLVQGDTTSAFTAALAGFYRRVPVVHLEAGLRTIEADNPFPEEMNRRLVSRLADLHLAPTTSARDNLAVEGIPDPVVVTGNTVIDAFLWAQTRPAPSYEPRLQRAVDGPCPIVLITAHRRESWGEPMRRIASALHRLATEHPEWLLVLPMHRNPRVRADLEPRLEGLPNVLLTEPLGYTAFSQLVRRASFVITDSGGIQEEAPSLGKPVLVLRSNTERPEGVIAGTVAVIGTETGAIEAAAAELMTDPLAHARMAHATNPYGDGRAAERVIAALRWRYLGGPRPDDFETATPLPGPVLTPDTGTDR